MRRTLSFRALAMGLFVALLASYVLCIVGDLLFGWSMYLAWAPLLPGFAWPLTAGGILIGLLWVTIYSLYFAAMISFPYNYFVKRQGVS